MSADPATNRPTRARRAAETVFAALVVGFLLSFPLRTVLRGRVAETITLDGENRDAAPFPDLRETPPEKWGAGIEAWYGDAMPGRRWFVKRARSAHLKRLRSPFGVFVPGRGGQWFRTGKDWPELEDYLGAFRLSEGQLDRWADLFAGRRAWAEAMGCTFVSVLSPPKVQMFPDAPMPWISRHRGECLFDQLRAHLERLGETNTVLSLRDALRPPPGERPRFHLGADHHPNAEGIYRMFEAIAAAIPGCGVEPWFGTEPPPAVAAFREPGCWTDGTVLHVSAPGSRPAASPLRDLSPTDASRRQTAAMVRGDGTGLRVMMAHTSFLRYNFPFWEDPSQHLVLPFDARTGRIDSLLWKMLGEADLDYITAESVPDAIVQEINEWHLSLFPVGYGGAIRNAAAFARAAEIPSGAAPAPDAEVCVRAVLSGVEAGGQRAMQLRRTGPKASAVLLRDGEPVESVPVRPGVRRPVFFSPVPFGDGDFRVVVRDGSADVGPLAVRLVRPREGVVESAP